MIDFDRPFAVTRATPVSQVNGTDVLEKSVKAMWFDTAKLVDIKSMAH